MFEIPLLISLVLFFITFAIGLYLFVSKQLAKISGREQSEDEKKIASTLHYMLYGFATATLLPLIFLAINSFSTQKRVLSYSQSVLPALPVPQEELPSPASSPSFSEIILNVIFSVYTPPAPTSDNIKNNNEASANSSISLGMVILGIFGVLILSSFKWFKPGESTKTYPLNAVFYVVFALILFYLVGIIFSVIYFIVWPEK